MLTRGRRGRSRGLLLILVLLIGALIVAARIARPGARAHAADPDSCEQGAYAVAMVDGSPRLALELAETPDEQTRGLMFRESLPWDEGMLFVYNRPVRTGFWMGNTLIPLSIAFVLEDGTILDIQDMEQLGILDPAKPLPRYTTYYPPGPYFNALETNQGWFAANNVHPGDRLVLCLGQLN